MVTTENQIHTAHLVFSIIGYATTLALYLFPIPTITTVWKEEGAVHKYSPWPYLLVMLNSLFHVVHSLPWIHKDYVLMGLTGVGAVLQMVYVVVFCIKNANGRVCIVFKKKNILICFIMFLPAKIMIAYMCVAIILVGSFGIGEGLSYHGQHDAEKKRTNVIGIMCCITGVMVCVMPLGTLCQVIAQHDVKLMSLTVSATSTANGLIRIIMCILKSDKYIAISSWCAFMSGLLQLGVYRYYRFHEPRAVNDEEQPAPPAPTDGHELVVQEPADGREPEPLY